MKNLLLPDTFNDEDKSNNTDSDKIPDNNDNNDNNDIASNIVATQDALVNKDHQLINVPASSSDVHDRHYTPLSTALNQTSPLQLTQEPQYRIEMWDLDTYLSRFEVVLFSEHPVIIKLGKMIRSSGLNGFHDVSDLLGIVALLWFMAQASRPFRYAEGKLVEQQGWILLDVCAIQPLKRGGRLSDLNIVVVPEAIAKRNNRVMPPKQSEEIYCGESTRILGKSPYNGGNLLRKMAVARSMREVDEFLTQSAALLNSPLTVTTEPNKTSHPLFSLLKHEFSALPAFQAFSVGLGFLKNLLLDNTGMLEAAALVMFDAATLGNPQNVINRLLEMSNRAYFARLRNEPEASQYHYDVINLINDLMVQRFSHNLLNSPAKFEEQFYNSLFSLPPLPLVW